MLSAVPREELRGWSYLLKKTVGDVASLGRAIEGSAAGFIVLDASLVGAARPSMATGALAHVTPRQREVLGLIAQGYTNAAIAEQMVLSLKSVENLINQLYQDLGIDRQDSSLQPRVKAVLIYLQEIQNPSSGLATRGIAG